MMDNNGDDPKYINILIAEDNEVSRQMMAGILETQGYNVISVGDGDAAIAAVEKDDIDLALVDINMSPKGGFDFMRYLVVNGIKIMTVVITSDDSGDILVKATELGVRRVLQKPVDPDLLLRVVNQLLKRKGLNPQPLAVNAYDKKHTTEELMQRAIDLADQNAKSKKGGPFGAVVASQDGEILGEGVNGITSRVDPVAHAEVMAIRHAVEKLGKSDLNDCVLYCSSMPTMMGQALIKSVGIPKVYYGLTHDDISAVSAGKTKTPDPEFEQMSHAEASEMFDSWQALDEKVAD